MMCCLPLAYWTYWLIQDGFDWLALLPGILAFFLVVGGLGLLFERPTLDDDETNEDSGQDAGSTRSAA